MGFRTFSARRGKALILRRKSIEVSTMSGYEACLVRKVASTVVSITQEHLGSGYSFAQTWPLTHELRHGRLYAASTFC